jgi:hypothetical protein
MRAALKIAASFSSVSLLPVERIAAITRERFCFENTSAILDSSEPITTGDTIPITQFSRFI